jgi:hypothetical protein
MTNAVTVGWTRHLMPQVLFPRARSDRGGEVTPRCAECLASRKHGSEVPACGSAVAQGIDQPRSRAPR